MISSRRLAREWALKILYQSDVGKIPIEESEAAALERLRREFVQRASRAAAGSFLEECLADAITQHLSDLLPEYDPSIERSLRGCLDQVFSAGEYWAHVNAEFCFNRQSFNALWEVPRVSEGVSLPSEFGALPAAVISDTAVSSPGRARLAHFLAWARHALPEAAMVAFGREVRQERPRGAGLKVTHEYVLDRWRQFAAGMSDRWAAAGTEVEKQIFDWMRVAGFTTRLVNGVYRNSQALDARLQALEIGWSLDRQVSVDRNILRMATYELTHVESIPSSATINEAVELAKKYSTAESGRFVNGVLGAIVAQNNDCGATGSESGGVHEPIDTPDIDLETDELSSEEELARI